MMILIISNKELKLLRDALRLAVTDLTTAIDGVAARQPTPSDPPPAIGGSVSDADVQTAIDGVNAQTTRLATLVNPTPVPVSASNSSETGPAPVAATDFANPIK